MKNAMLILTLVLSNLAWAAPLISLTTKATAKDILSSQKKKAEGEKSSDAVLILNLSNGKKLMIYDNPKINLGDEKRTGSGGGWQPETQRTPEESVALEIIRLAAQEKCDADHIANALDEAFSQTTENLVLDISDLAAELKSCLRN